MNISASTFKTVIVTLTAFIIVIAIFQVGVFVGYRKASYSYRWGDNYHRMFAGPRHGFTTGFPNGPRPQRGMIDPGFMDAHGVFGTVLKIDGDTLIIKDKDNIERSVTVATSTTISTPKGPGNISDISADARVVIIGQPNEQGPIDAKLIRVFEKNKLYEI